MSLFSNPSKLATTRVPPVMEHNNKHNFDVLQRLFKGEQLVFSSFSSLSAMLMLYFGSDGNTKRELEQAFKINPNRSDEMHLALEVVNSALAKSNSEDVVVSVTNAGFVSHTCKLEQEFVKKIASIGTLQNLDYSNSELARQYINEWVSNNTNSLIPELLSSGDVSPDTLLTLVNCLYFKGNWELPFNPRQTYKSKFFTLSDSIVDVDMMTLRDETFPYWEDDSAQYLEMFYEGKEFAMGVILPKNKGPVEFPKNFDLIVGNLQLRDVNVYFPKFKQKSKHELSDVFKNMGINDLFSNADLSKITKDSVVNASSIIQEVVVIVDETGTEAAAATAAVLEMCVSVPPKYFRADHTFQYYIRHVPTNTLLFHGVWDGKNDE